MTYHNSHLFSYTVICERGVRIIIRFFLYFPPQLHHYRLLNSCIYLSSPTAVAPQFSQIIFPFEWQLS
jgi:hypothetical protein